MQTETNENQKCESISVPYFEGYRCIGWKIPKVGEYYLNSITDNCHTLIICNEVTWVYPKLIYEELPPKRYIFEELPEKRKAYSGEIYIDNTGEIQTWTFSEASLSKYTILKEVNE